MKTKILYCCLGIVIVVLLCLTVYQYKECRRLEGKQSWLQFSLFLSHYNCLGNAAHRLETIIEGEPDAQAESCYYLGSTLPHFHYFILYFKHIGIDAAPLEHFMDELTAWHEESIDRLANGEEINVSQKEAAVHYLEILRELEESVTSIMEEYDQDRLHSGVVSRDVVLLKRMEDLIYSAD